MLLQQQSNTCVVLFRSQSLSRCSCTGPIMRHLLVTLQSYPRDWCIDPAVAHLRSRTTRPKYSQADHSLIWPLEEPQCLRVAFAENVKNVKMQHGQWTATVASTSPREIRDISKNNGKNRIWLVEFVKNVHMSDKSVVAYVSSLQIGFALFPRHNVLSRLLVSPNLWHP